eukprot:m.169874 g.169874  ORF g.169874 m.169874 type:complete len:169 (-) comp16674_c0_seq1:101-607(-)
MGRVGDLLTLAELELEAVVDLATEPRLDAGDLLEVVRGPGFFGERGDRVGLRGLRGKVALLLAVDGFFCRDGGLRVAAFLCAEGCFFRGTTIATDSDLTSEEAAEGFAGFLFARWSLAYLARASLMRLARAASTFASVGSILHQYDNEHQQAAARQRTPALEGPKMAV